jgi:hypothetical protein
VILSGQGQRTAGAAQTRFFELGSVLHPAPDLGIERPGTYRLRAVLEPDADRGWGDPEIRSIWPEAIVTDWLEVEVVRR